MTQTERRYYLLHELLREQNLQERVEIPAEKDGQAQLLRGLFNVRMPKMASPDFLAIQDAYLQEEIQRKGIIRLTDLTPVQDDIYLWQGDITTLACDAIVNAANAQMLGCFCPNHGCIDNAIHTFAGVQLRASCAKIMEQQGRPEPTGRAKITPAYNLPCKYVLHTVGPIVHGVLTERDRELLISCYRSCLKLAEQNDIKSIAFCCISTGEFHFPEDIAAQIAVNTVTEYREQSHSRIEVIFNVFKDKDYQIYRKLLSAD